MHLFRLSCLETTFYTFMFHSLGVNRTIFKGKLQDETYLWIKYTISQTSTPRILDFQMFGANKIRLDIYSTPQKDRTEHYPTKKMTTYISIF